MSDDLNFLTILGPASERDVVTLEAGAVLFAKGDPATAMYVVKSGKIEISNEGRIFEVVSAGGILGEMALALEMRRSATARAVVRSEVIPIDEDQFLKLVQTNPFFAIWMIRVISRRLDARTRSPRPGEARD